MNQHFILGEILDYLKDFSESFPHVDLDILFDQVTAVRRKNVDPETQIRQFLQAFENAPTFKEAFDQLDSETQKKVVSFRDGASTHDLTKTRGFSLPASPPAKHHFRFLDVVHSLFTPPRDDERRPEDHKQQPRGETKLESVDAKSLLIYEDEGNKKIMKARVHLAISVEEC